MSVEALLGTDGSSPPICRRCARTRARPLARPTCARCSRARAIVASHRNRGVHPGAGRVLAALLAAGRRRGSRHVAHARTVAGRELAAAIDNPVVTAGRPGRVATATSTAPRRLRAGLPGHRRRRPGQSIAERRTDRLLDRRAQHGLPPFLADDPGVDSGHMIAQYTQAAIVSELKRLAVPASVDSIPARPCRRTTSRWAGRRRASCDGPSTG